MAARKGLRWWGGNILLNKLAFTLEYIYRVFYDLWTLLQEVIS